MNKDVRGYKFCSPYKKHTTAPALQMGTLCMVLAVLHENGSKVKKIDAGRPRHGARNHIDLIPACAVPGTS